MTVNEAKKHLRIDADIVDDDDYIQSLITAATTYINQQTGKMLWKSASISTDELYNIAIKMMIAHWYENRTPQITGTIISSFDNSVDSIINHIALCGDYT